MKEAQETRRFVENERIPFFDQNKWSWYEKRFPKVSFYMFDPVFSSFISTSLTGGSIQPNATRGEYKSFDEEWCERRSS